MLRITLLSTVVGLVQCCCRDNQNPATPRAVPSTCGHSKYYYATNNPGSEIVGGRDAKLNEFPWIARLTTDYGHTFCGASIINENWLLSAAHCFYNESEGGMTAEFGDHKKTEQENSQFSILIDQESSIVHPEYVNEKDFDFSLLRLATPLTFDDWSVQRICLPSDCDDSCTLPGTAAFVHGWGNIHTMGIEYPDTLQAAVVYIVDQDECRDSFQERITITDNMVCAAVEGGGIDACQGDSGGPLVINDDGYFKLCGVTSFGIGCGDAMYPGVYAKVCSVLSWIHEIISN